MFFRKLKKISNILLLLNGKGICDHANVSNRTEQTHILKWNLSLFLSLTPFFHQYPTQVKVAMIHNNNKYIFAYIKFSIFVRVSEYRNGNGFSKGWAIDSSYFVYRFLILQYLFSSYTVSFFAFWCLACNTSISASIWEYSSVQWTS